MNYYWESIAGAVFLLFICMPLYRFLKRRINRKLSLAIKGMCTLIPIFFCFMGVLEQPTSPHIWMLVSLCLCLVGDITIDIRFIWGMGAFFFAHIGFMILFFQLSPFNGWSVCIFIPAVIIVYLIYNKYLERKQKSKLPFLVYAAILLAMGSTAVFLPASIGKQGLIIMAGAILFVTSDLLLARKVLIKEAKLYDTLSLPFYFSGIYLLAMSVYLF